MKAEKEQKDSVSAYLDNQEAIANTYVMRCFTVTMVVYLITFVLNIVGIFTIEQSLMWKGFLPALLIYSIVQVVIKAKWISLSDKRTKYFIPLFPNYN